VLHDQGREAEAIAATERAMRCEAPGPLEVLNYTNLLQRQGRVDEAEAGLRQLVVQYPDLALAKGNLAGLLLNRSYTVAPPQARPLLDEAERLLTAALAQAPRQHELLNTMGVLLHTRGRTNEAVPFLQRSLASRPDFVMASRNLGIAYGTLGKVREALAVWLPILDRLPADADLRVLVADALRVTGSVAEARRLLQDALRIDPRNTMAREMLQQLDGGR
jgi:tetratricopeptide (TPR) repeat protein